MIKHELEAGNTDPDLYSLRAQINLLFGKVWTAALNGPTDVVTPPSSLFFFLQSTKAYYDACSALDLDPSHSEATRLKRQLEDKALAYKNQVRTLKKTSLKAICKVPLSLEHSLSKQSDTFASYPGLGTTLVAISTLRAGSQ